MQDSVKALEKAQAARTTSEVQSALADLVRALEPWLLKGAPQHYAEKKLALYHEDKSKRGWVQMAGKPINPYSDAGAALMPWPQPETAERPKPDGPGSKDAPAAEMTGHRH